MSILTVTLASALIATSAANAALQFANLQRRASKRRSVWREVASERGILLRTSLVSLFYGEWLLVKSATGSSSGAAWLVTGIEAAIFAWVVWDCGVWLSRIRRSRGHPLKSE
jgi:hypothetical protein